jgi:hypothetical protein
VASCDAAVRIVRFEVDRALVEVPHTVVPAARAAWNGSWTTMNGTSVLLRTRSTWGTLAKGKAWLRAR